jgi:microcystin-dependent protein
MATINGQFFNLGGGGIGTWDPIADPNKIEAGKSSSPNAYFLLNKMSTIIDDVAYASYGTLIFFDPEKKRWQIGAGDDKNLGVFDNLTALQAKYPVGQAGQYALLKSTNTVWYWSTTTSAWVNGGSLVPADVLKQTDIVINLGSTDNTKVASASLATLLDTMKVDKVTGKGLSTEDYTTVEKTKLAGIAEGAEVNVKANWAETDANLDSFILNKPDIYLKSETYSKSEIDTKDSALIPLTQKGQALGVATLDSSGKVPSTQLNATGVKYYASISSFPVLGATDNIYVAENTNISYIWKTSTNTYVESLDSTVIKESELINAVDSTSILLPPTANALKVTYDAKIDKTSIVTDFNSTDNTKVASAPLVKTLNDGKIDKTSIVDDLTTGGSTNVASAQTVKTLDLNKAEKTSVYTKTEIDSSLALKIDKVLSQDGKIPLFNTSGNLVSSNLSPSNFEPADATILKESELVTDLVTNSNTRPVASSQTVALKTLVDSKEPAITSGLSTQYWRGDKTFQALNQNAVGITNRFITNVTQEAIFSGKESPSDDGTQVNYRVRLGNTTTASTKGADFELQAGNGTSGSGDVVFMGAPTLEDSISVGTTSGSLAASVTAITFSHTVPTSTNRLLLVQVVCSGGQQSSSATFASVAMTLAERTQSTNLTIETYYLVAPSQVTGIVQVNFSNPVNNTVVRAINLTGVDQTTPLGQKSEAFNNNQTTSASLSVATVTGQIVVDLIGTYNVVATSSGGQTQIWSGSTAQQEKGQGGYEIAQQPSTSVSYTFSNSSYAMHVIALNKVGGTSLQTIVDFGRATPQGFKANGLILPPYVHTVGGTVSLTQSSPSRHKFYNSGQSYTIKLPKSIYLSLGTVYEFTNRSATSVTIQNNTGSTLATVPVNYTIYLELTDNTSYEGLWETGFQSSTGSVIAYIDSQKGVASGIAPLNSSNLIPTQYIPASASGFTVGDIKQSWQTIDHNGWLIIDGRSNLLRTTYSNLFSTFITNKGTCTISSSGIVTITLANHGLVAGQQVVFQTTGTLPSPMVANTTIYYVVSSSLTTNSFQIATSLDGIAFSTTTAGSGVHTLFATKYSLNLGNGSTTFGLPNYSGRTIIGAGNGSGLTNRIAGEFYGAETHILTINEMPAHTHDMQGYSNTAAGSDRQVRNRNTIGGDPLDLDRALSRGGGQPHNNMQPSVAINSFIYSGV